MQISILLITPSVLTIIFGVHRSLTAFFKMFRFIDIEHYKDEQIIINLILYAAWL